MQTENNTRKKYEDYYVAFIDILGFKQIIQDYDCNKIYNIFMYLKRYSKGHANHNDKIMMAYEDMSFRILSDSIIIFVKVSIKDSLVAIIDICSRLQFSLLNLEQPVLLRGGIAKGNLYYDNEIIYGNGLVAAYLLENDHAIMPRIIFERNLLSDFKKSSKLLDAFNDLGLISTLDEQYDFVNFLAPMMYMLVDVEKEKETLLINLKSLCHKYIDSGKDDKIRDKYLWLQSFIDDFEETFLNCNCRKIK